MEEIISQWEEFRKSPFPSEFAGEEIDGVCLTEIDYTVAGCISTFIASRGKLSGHQLAILKKCTNELESVVLKIPLSAKPYFCKLLHLCQEIISECK